MDTHIVFLDALVDFRHDRVGLASQLGDICQLHVGALLSDLDGLGQLALNGVNVSFDLLDRHFGDGLVLKKKF